MVRVHREYLGWALRFGPGYEADCTPGRHYLGIYALRDSLPRDPVVRTALFATRRQAAAWLKNERAIKGEWSRKNYYRGMRPVRVRVAIEEKP